MTPLETLLSLENCDIIYEANIHINKRKEPLLYGIIHYDAEPNFHVEVLYRYNGTEWIESSRAIIYGNPEILYGEKDGWFE